MDLEFYKYHGAGNDFVIFDNRDKIFPEDNRIERIQNICKRHFGVGSDGLILIESDPNYDFYMEFYNPDGSQSFCGNGSRCAVMFAYHMGIVAENCSFNSIHGINHAVVVDKENISLRMFDVDGIEKGLDHYYLDTGSPHYNIYVQDVSQVDLIPFARSIRYNDRFKEIGTNVNLIQRVGERSIKVRTYERGVEDETLSCGTGVTACAITELVSSGFSSGKVNIETLGGQLSVEVKSIVDQNVSGVTLIGPAVFVFKGEVNV
ncbi:MAG: diaminopimelate epimerase [Flavobacteriales bacterium]|nr:diaminopimelate epimerase [Flavobacteriales bacterium]MCB9196221.1 diaminopimelate epimerase [Flavobacteriales bacterium]